MSAAQPLNDESPLRQAYRHFVDEHSAKEIRDKAAALNELLESYSHAREVEPGGKALAAAVGALISSIDVAFQTAESNGRQRRGGLAPWKLRRLARHVECNLDGNLQTSELAKVARLSVCYFSREFRKTVGVPPHRYVTQKRIEHAQRLIATTNSSITDIAAECGLSDQSHLTRLFRRFVGETPGAWRRTQPRSTNQSTQELR